MLSVTISTQLDLTSSEQSPTAFLDKSNAPDKSPWAVSRTIGRSSPRFLRLDRFFDFLWTCPRPIFASGLGTNFEKKASGASHGPLMSTTESTSSLAWARGCILLESSLENIQQPCIR